MTPRQIAVLTSGGDAPGMNAAIRAVTRTAVHRGWTAWGVRRGYAGLLEDDLVPLTARDVGGILERGGTMLRSSRCAEFETLEGQRVALDVLRRRSIDALVVVGGNGSQAGSAALHRLGFPVVGVASTIDNDLVGTDISIGVDTALNVALEAIDRLRVTATSLERVFLVEVMGRESGYLALMAGIAGGAEAIIIPESETAPEDLAGEIRDARARGKNHALVVVAEGSQYGAAALAAYFREHRERLGYELRVTSLGYVQRGGIPTVSDRLLATRLGAGATECLADGRVGMLVGQQGCEIVPTPLEEVVGRTKPIDTSLLQLARILAR